MTCRQFTNKGSYFVLTEQSSWMGVYNPETVRLERGEPTGWAKTHIIVTHSCVKGAAQYDAGLQILRFHGVGEDGPWELASNPYAGVYLTPGEWAQVFRAMNLPIDEVTK